MKDLSIKMIVDEIGYEFSFNRIIASGSIKYFVTAKNEFNKSFAFEMKRYYNTWKLVQPVPEWLLNIEPELNSFINEHAEQQQTQS